MLATPQLFRRSSGMWWWAVTGAMTAGLVLAVALLVNERALVNANLALSLAWAVFMLLGVPIFVLPFLASFGIARFLPLSSRGAGAAYGAVFHIGAHCAVLYGLELNGLAFPAILAPLVVGGLWGSWLPECSAES